jgi:bacterial/archaeal transporter family-2 protein
MIPMTRLLSLFAILAGISNPLQSGSNSELMKATNAPVVAAFVVYAIGSVCLLACIPLFGFSAREAFGKLSGVPWWAFIGGICNALFLMASLLVTKRLGSGTFTVLVVVSAVLTSLALDHFGLLGFEVRSVTWPRFLGGLLAIGGVFLIAVF